MFLPKSILLISGKRKCGKDFLSEMLHKRLDVQQNQIIRISAPIKSEWAKKLNLNLEELLGDGPYKERYRKDMIVWSDEVRVQDYGHFCRMAMKEANAAIIIVSDIRRKTDIRFFKETYGDIVRCIRLTCSDEVRIKRGWQYTEGIDNVTSECDLDDFQEWDLVLQNNNQTNAEQLIDLIIEKCQLL